MTRPRATLRILTLTAAAAALSACSTDPNALDWDLRPADAFTTAPAALAAETTRPAPDGRGVISYPGYQVAVARRGDTVGSIAARVGLPAAELASYNAVSPDAVLNQGEVLALPRRVADGGAAGAGAVPGAPIQSGTIEVTTLAAGAIDRAQGTGQGAAPVAPGGVEPIRHRVERGETAYSIARLYNVSARSVAEWNGLGPDLAVREGQYLLIPVGVQTAAAAPTPVTQPGQGSPLAPPPSAAQPLPAERPTAAAQPAPGTPERETLGTERTTASAARLAMPAEGSIVRGFVPGRTAGIDIGAAGGSPVKAAADGTVAAITRDTDQVSILVLRHADGLLTVYANIDNIQVAKGDSLKRGQTFAAVRAANPAFLRFEVRKGVEAVDPLPYLQ